MDMQNKKWTDVAAMAMIVCAIITGFKLHLEVHHLYVYDNAGLWTAHIIAGLIVVLALIFHCYQHRFWFTNYVKIPVVRKGVTSLLFALATLAAVSGTVLALGSHSHFVSIFHYVTAIAFTLLAIGHVAKRWKIFKAFFNSKNR